MRHKRNLRPRTPPISSIRAADQAHEEEMQALERKYADVDKTSYLALDALGDMAIAEILSMLRYRVTRFERRTRRGEISEAEKFHPAVYDELEHFITYMRYRSRRSRL